MARNIQDVIDQMLEKIPPSEERLRQRLEHVRRSAGFIPPEMMAGVWNSVADILRVEIGYPPKEQWGHMVANIFGDRRCQHDNILGDCKACEEVTV